MAGRASYETYLQTGPGAQSVVALGELTLAIAEYSREHRYAPTLRELVELTDATTISVIAHRLRRLRQRGWVAYEEGVARTLLLTGNGWAAADIEPPVMIGDPRDP